MFFHLLFQYTLSCVQDISDSIWALALVFDEVIGTTEQTAWLDLKKQKTKIKSD